MAKRKPAQQYPWWITSWDKFLFLFILGVFLVFSPGQNIYTIPEALRIPFLRQLPFVLPSPAPYPVNRTGIFPGTEITAAGVVIIDVDSGVFLYTRNSDILLSPASTTKILTALVALDHYQLDDVVTVKTVVNDGQIMGLVPGERMTVENLLYGILIKSGNDAAYALADHFPGGVSKFVEAMNTKAKDLHLTKSTFTNPVGYDDPNHKMTPIDLARLARVALDNKTIAKMVAIPEITISDVTHTYFHPLKNINQLLGKIPGVGGIKTGWTEEAGENLVTLVERNGHRVIIVLLQSKDRFGETAKLIDWVFANYVWETYQVTQ
ncbi:serine hydrolase [Candidatus Gottesmanbacteria bacterium]|nr:serine hydrolase [Candidatus Gottesmanbacteria bacterium]